MVFSFDSGNKTKADNPILENLNFLEYTAPIVYFFNPSKSKYFPKRGYCEWIQSIGSFGLNPNTEPETICAGISKIESAATVELKKSPQEAVFPNLSN